MHVSNNLYAKINVIHHSIRSKSAKILKVRTHGLVAVVITVDFSEATHN